MPQARAWRVVVLALVVGAGGVALASCAGRQAADTTICPEQRRIRCIGGAICSFDRQRGCRVCQCATHMQDPNSSPDLVKPEDGTRPDPIPP